MFFRTVKKKLLQYLTQIVRVWMRWHGVQLGRGGCLYGFPLLKLAKGSSVEIGDGVHLNSLTRLNTLTKGGRVRFSTRTAHARIVIKDGVGISNSAFSCWERIVIGKNTHIGADCVILDADAHEIPLGSGNPVQCAPIEIGEGVLIGMRSMILKGVTIGDGAVIGAGSVVVKSIPAHCIAAGNPARVIRERINEK